MVGCQNVGSWIGRQYLIYIGAGFISISWAYHTFILAKSTIKSSLCGRCSIADLFAGFAAISGVTAITTTGPLSLVSLVFGGLQHRLCWPTRLVG